MTTRLSLHRGLGAALAGAALTLGAMALPALAQTPPPPDYVEVDVQPIPLTQTRPDYPADLRAAGVEGRVIARVWVGSDGIVKDATVQRSDDERFNAAALAAVRQWTFSPARAAGVAKDVWVSIPIRFRTSPEAPANAEPAPPPPGLIPTRSEGPSAPMPRTQVGPEYPAVARATGTDGRVMVEVQIGADGTVTSGRVLHVSAVQAQGQIPADHPAAVALGEAALAAARQWTFVPGAPTTGVIPIRFKKR